MVTSNINFYCNAQSVLHEQTLIDRILHSKWWLRTTDYVDSHYTVFDGIMLSDHLIAVAENVDILFNRRQCLFVQKMFALLEQLNLGRNQLYQELRIVSFLHDIGKTEDDKSKLVPHPVYGYYTNKRHGIVSVYAAIDILESEELLTDKERARIYTVIEEHDISYGLFREWTLTGKVPDYALWKELNDKIDKKTGAGLMYLLLFKLADTHGHQNISDVIWFFKEVKEKYFSKHKIDLPIPNESDVW